MLKSFPHSLFLHTGLCNSRVALLSNGKRQDLHSITSEGFLEDELLKDLVTDTAGLPLLSAECLEAGFLYILFRDKGWLITTTSATVTLCLMIEIRDL